MTNLLVSLMLLLSSFHGAGTQPDVNWHYLASDPLIEAYQGYRVRIQMRPCAEIDQIDAWAGGYLTDGLFIQNGLSQPNHWLNCRTQAFTWVWGRDGLQPKFEDLPWPALTWITFEGVRVGSQWQFSYTDPAGKHLQYTVEDASDMSAFELDAETMRPEWGWFPTQAMRKVEVLSNGRWHAPPLVDGNGAPQCGTAEIKATPGPNLVFRWTGGQPHEKGCYKVLSR